MKEEIKQLKGYFIESYHKVNTIWYKFIDPISALILADIIRYYTHDSPERFFDYSLTHIAEKLGLHRNTVARKIKKLKDLEIISSTVAVIQNESGLVAKVNQLRLVPKKLLELEAKFSDAPKSDDRCTKNVHKDNSNNNNNNNNNNKIKGELTYIHTSSSHNTGRSKVDQLEYPSEFNEDWQLYKEDCWDERFGNKRSAFKMWLNTLKAQGPSFRSELMRRTHIYLSGCRINKRWCKHASTFWNPKDALYLDEAYDELPDGYNNTLAFSKLCDFEYLNDLLTGNKKIVFTGVDRRTGCVLLKMKKDKELYKIWDGESRGRMYEDFKDRFISLYNPTQDYEWDQDKEICLYGNVISERNYG